MDCLRLLNLVSQLLKLPVELEIETTGTALPFSQSMGPLNGVLNENLLVVDTTRKSTRCCPLTSARL